MMMEIRGWPFQHVRVAAMTGMLAGKASASTPGAIVFEGADFRHRHSMMEP
jgi:hypothetical protein